MSEQLKADTFNKYEKVNIAFSQKSNLDSNKGIKRDEIIVDLSLITDTNTTFAMDKFTQSSQDVRTLRVKQKNLADENKIKYEKIITSLDDYVIISGIPGCGKTTLIETLLYRWAKDELWQNDVRFDFVFVVYLRDLVRFKDDKEITAENILKYYYPKYNFQQNPQNTLIILEGFDELYGKEELGGKYHLTSYTRAIYDLLNPNNPLFSFTRIVTSRPQSCSILFQTILSQPMKQTKRVMEVTGFSENSIYRYLHKLFPEGNEAEKMVSSLRLSAPLVYDMMVIPFYCWGVCFLLKENVEVKKLGPTTTTLMANLLSLFIRNHGNREESLPLKDVIRQEKFKEYCVGLAQLAYDLETKSKINFTQEDLPGDHEIKNLVQYTGMIVKIERNDGWNTYYQFFHYSFHEFLVALHLYIKGESSFIREYSHSSSIAKMLSGLIGGGLCNSQSPRVIQEFTKVFRTVESENLSFNSTIFSVFTHLSLTLYDFVFEYSNPVNSKATITVFDHQEQFIKGNVEYFRKQCEKGNIFFKKIILASIFDGWWFENIEYICDEQEIFLSNIISLPSSLEIVKKNKIIFDKVFNNVIYSELQQVNPCYPCRCIEIIDYKPTQLHWLSKRKSRYLKIIIIEIYSVNYQTGFNISDLTKLYRLDICEEMEIHHKVSCSFHENRQKECLLHPHREEILALQKEVEEAIYERKFKTLETFKIVGCCLGNKSIDKEVDIKH